MANDDRQETVEDVVEELRSDNGFPVPYAPNCYRAIWKDDCTNYIARIEAALKRERETVTERNQFGNAAAMREALEMARDALKSAEKYVYGDPPNGGAIGWDDVWPSKWHNALEAVERALSAPARNCELYPSYDAAYEAYRATHNRPHDAAFHSAMCEWLLAPAAERKGEGDGR